MADAVRGAEDLRREADQLAARLPSALAPLARVAFNYRWCWTLGGSDLFAAVDADRWEACCRNPVRLLQEAPTLALERAAADRTLIQQAYSLEECIAVECSRPPQVKGIDPKRPVAFLCAEYGVHGSLPVYAGGLGVLAGDLVKAASDSGLPLVAVGLLYGQGYFRQRMDISGWQHEYWVESDPPRLPGALVTRDGLEPLVIHVPIRGRQVATQIWRFAVGRVPLFLLDTDLPENDPVDRWITSRLYVGDRDTRLAQYALLGIGGVRALRAVGVEPGVLHLNEGHPALAPLELAAADVACGASFDEALEAARARTVFTTHTPVPAGNETYPAEQMQRVFQRAGRAARGRLGADPGPGADRSREPRRAARDDCPGPAREPRPQRREPTPRRGGSRNLAARLRGEEGRRRAHRPRHQRGPPVHVDGGADPAPAGSAPGAGAGSRAAWSPTPGPRSPTFRTQSSGGSAASCGPGWWSTCASAPPWTGWRGAKPPTTWTRPRAPSIPSASPSASPGGWPPTSACIC